MYLNTTNYSYQNAYSHNCDVVTARVVSLIASADGTTEWMEVGDMDAERYNPMVAEVPGEKFCVEGREVTEAPTTDSAVATGPMREAVLVGFIVMVLRWVH